MVRLFVHVGTLPEAFPFGPPVIPGCALRRRPGIPRFKPWFQNSGFDALRRPGMTSDQP